MPKSNGSPVFFMLSDIAQVLGLPLSRVKNWSRGRPITVGSSVQAHGTGSRNLYSMNDARRLGIAAQMNADGFTPVVIQTVLDEIRSVDLLASIAVVRNNMAGHHAWKHDPQPRVKIVPAGVVKKRIVGALLSDSPACYVVDLPRIASAVDHLIARFINQTNNVRRKRSVEPLSMLVEDVDHAADQSERTGKIKRMFKFDKPNLSDRQ